MVEFPSVDKVSLSVSLPLSRVHFVDFGRYTVVANDMYVYTHLKGFVPPFLTC